MKIALSVADMTVGGIATFVLNLGQLLHQAGHTVTVIAQNHGEWWSRLAAIGVQGYCPPRQRWDSRYCQVRHFASYLTEQAFDLLVVNIGINNHLPMMALPLLPDDLPVALILHNDRPEVYALAAVNSRAWNCAVGVSPQVTQRAGAHVGRQPVRFIPSGIALPTEQPERHHPAKAELAAPTPLRLLFVGRLDNHQKGIFRLPAILAACRQQAIPVRLTVIGDGPDQARLNQLFRDREVTDLVELWGFQPHESVLAAMRSHHGLLLPSNYEGLPIVLLEAQAQGCVPIAARLPGITDHVLQERITGLLVTPTDVDGYVHSIEQLLVAEQWHAMRNAGVDWIGQQFSLQQMGARYLTIFADLCNGAYPLLMARSQLWQQQASPYRWRDYLPIQIDTCCQGIVTKVRQKVSKVSQQQTSVEGVH